MKKIFLSLAVVSLLFSCGTDDDGGEETNQEVNGGTYLLTSFETESSLDIDGDGDSSNDLLVETGCLQNERIVFADNGVATALSSSFLDIYVDVDANGNTTQLIECELANEETALVYTQTGTTVTVTSGAEDILVGQINGNTIVFTLNDEFVGEFENEDGSDGTFELEETVTITYTRQ